MTIQIKYYMTDGIDLTNIIGEEKTFICQVKTFSDYRYLLGMHIMNTEPDDLYATIKSIKVDDHPYVWLNND
jgi:hypothetical protein